MWGNALGWSLSAALVVLVMSVGVVIYSATQITAATELSSAANLEPLNPPVAAGVVRQNEPGDAGPIYRSAINSFDSERARRFVMDPSGTPPKAIQLVLDATHKSDMNLFSANPSELINYDARHDALEKLGELGDYVVNCGIALLSQQKDADARRYLEASFALGLKLYRERLCFDEYVTARHLLGNSLQYLAKCQPDGSEQRRSLEEQAQALVEYDEQRVEPIRRVLNNINISDMDLHAGDFYRFAAKAKDPMLRVEGILSLGRLRFNASRAADQDNAMRAIRKYRDDPNPAVAAAATAAENLTIEVFRMQH